MSERWPVFVLCTLLYLNCCCSTAPAATEPLEALSAPPAYVDDGHLRLVESRLLCKGTYGAPMMFHNAGGDLCILWGHVHSEGEVFHPLSVCHKGQWRAPQRVFQRGENDASWRGLAVIADTRGEFRLFSAWPSPTTKHLVYGVYRLRVDPGEEGRARVEREGDVEIPRGLVRDKYMGRVSAVLPLPGEHMYLVAGDYLHDPLASLLTLPYIFAEPAVCEKWWWCRVTNGKATKPQAFFKWDWFNVEPPCPAGRQLVVGTDGKVHAVAGWKGTMAPVDYQLVHSWLEGEKWRTEEVYRGRADNGKCDEPMIAAGGNRLAIAGTFESRTEDPDTRHVKYIDKVVVWTKEEGGWRVALTLRDVLRIEDFSADATGRLYLLYNTESQLMLLTGAPGNWSKPTRVCGAASPARMVVEKDGVVHVAAERSYEGHYLRLEPASPVPGAEETEPSMTP